MPFDSLKIFHEGGIVMYPLLLCSLVASTLIIERAIFWFKRRLTRQRKRLALVVDDLRRGDLHGARERIGSCRDYRMAIVELGLENGLETLRGTMEMAYADEDRRINRFMMVLDTIVTLAPLLGILGTVLGIIESFELLGAGGGTTDPLAVTAGIGKALITTASGLVIAILTLIPYNFFRARVEVCRGEIEEVATVLELTLGAAVERTASRPGS